MRRYNGRMNSPTLKIIENLADIPVAQWDALAGNDPFLSHAYLYALQESGCATAQLGWRAQFLTLWQDGCFLGSMPLYLKMNSYGEHVFDFAWADAYHRHGLRYYPKLVCTVPYTPVTGARLLAGTSPETNKVRVLVLDLLALFGIYLAGMFYTMNISIDQHWWWVIHLCVEATCEVMVATIMAYSLMKVLGVRRRIVETWLYIEVALMFGSGILGLGHHYFWIGTPEY